MNQNKFHPPDLPRFPASDLILQITPVISLTDFRVMIYYSFHMKEDISLIKSSCPSCGHIDFDPSRQCECGYQADRTPSRSVHINSLQGTENKTPEGPLQKGGTDLKGKCPVGEKAIKEIDGWIFSCSMIDNCLYLGTPALKSFSLKLTLEDVEELLDFMYQKSGSGKTTRSIQLSEDNVSDVINRLCTMIEEKRARIPVNFNSHELAALSDMINSKLKA